MKANLQPVDAGELQVGKPLPWSVYDNVGRFLLAEGALIESLQQLAGLAENGLFRETSAGASSRKEGGASTGKHVAAEQIEELSAIKLAIGDTLQLQAFSSDKQRYFVKLIGFMSRRSVLVSHPKQDEKLIFIKEGLSFLVRGFAGTKTYEFSSNVISVCLTPYPYLHLTFPSQVKSTNMRGAVRVKFRMVCSIDAPATGLKVPAIIEDMSISGARIHASKAFGQVGDQVTVSMRMQMDGESQVFLVSSIIRNVREESDSQTGNKVIMHGMEFVQTVSIDLMMLQNFIYKSMLEG